MPDQVKWRNVNTGGSLLKQVSNINPDALEELFLGLGFSKLQEKTYKFMKEETSLIQASSDAASQDKIKPGNL